MEKNNSATHPVPTAAVPRVVEPMHDGGGTNPVADNATGMASNGSSANGNSTLPSTVDGTPASSRQSSLGSISHSSGSTTVARDAQKRFKEKKGWVCFVLFCSFCCFCCLKLDFCFCFAGLFFVAAAAEALTCGGTNA